MTNKFLKDDFASVRTLYGLNTEAWRPVLKHSTLVREVAGIICILQISDGRMVAKQQDLRYHSGNINKNGQIPNVFKQSSNET